MAAYIMVQVDIQDPSLYEDYRRMVKPTLDAYGGRFLVRGGAVENLEGSWAPSRFVVIEFDSAERARAWWASEEYAPAKEVRQRASHTEMILVEGV